jgi:hypothetical protein
MLHKNLLRHLGASLEIERGSNVTMGSNPTPSSRIERREIEMTRKWDEDVVRLPRAPARFCGRKPILQSSPPGEIIPSLS